MSTSDSPAEAARIEETAAIVAAAMDRYAERQRKDVSRLFLGLGSGWPLVTAVLSAGVALVAWLSYGVDPFEGYRETRDRKEDRSYQAELTKLHVDLGNDFLRVGQVSAAKDEFTRARELSEHSVAAEFGLLKTSLFQPILDGDQDPEISQLRLMKILENNPTDTHALAFLALVLIQIDPDTAESYLDKALESDPRNAFAYALKGDIRDIADKPDEALQMYDKAVELSSWNQSFLNNLAYHQYLHGDFADAATNYGMLLSLNPRFPLSYVMLLQTAIRLGNLEFAYANIGGLASLIDDSATWARRGANGSWLFYGQDGKKIWLVSPEEKKDYANYMIALIAALAHDKTTEQARFALAAEGGHAAARELIAHDISTLTGQLHADLGDELAAFSEALPRLGAK